MQTVKLCVRVGVGVRVRVGVRVGINIIGIFQLRHPV